MPHRFATLAVALAAAAPALAQDAVPDFSGATTVDAETFHGVGDLEFTAGGRVEVRRDDASLYAEQIRFNRESGRLEASGGVRLTSGADRFYGPRLHYNTQYLPKILERMAKTAPAGADLKSWRY